MRARQAKKLLTRLALATKIDLPPGHLLLIKCDYEPASELGELLRKYTSAPVILVGPGVEFSVVTTAEAARIQPVCPPPCPEAEPPR